MFGLERRVQPGTIGLSGAFHTPWEPKFWDKNSAPIKTERNKCRVCLCKEAPNSVTLKKIILPEVSRQDKKTHTIPTHKRLMYKTGVILLEFTVRKLGGTWFILHNPPHFSTQPVPFFIHEELEPAAVAVGQEPRNWGWLGCWWERGSSLYGWWLDKEAGSVSSNSRVLTAYWETHAALMQEG